MCGIAGIFAYNPSALPVNPAELLGIRDRMEKRGPDGSGLWISQDERVGLAHRRLAIIDLSESGAQPMANQDNSLRIVFNGEIYNYQELRRDLEARGHRFRSQSDTEVLLHLYQDHGHDLVRYLRGMYAFAIWDQPRQGIYLARDPFGIKPLYYANDGRTLRFASQVKALLAGGAVDTAPEPAGHAGFFLWGHVPDPYTFYKGVHALEAGSTLWATARGDFYHRRFADIAREMAEAENRDQRHRPPREEVWRRLGRAFVDSVKHHLLADVPVGVFLSAGLDSSLVTAAASPFSDGLRSFTLGFQEFAGTAQDETELAAKTAGYYHTRHLTRWISKEDFRHQMAQILQAMDQPSIDGVNTYFVAREAAATGLKVALSGLGGDELFGGYPSFRDIPRLARILGLTSSFPQLGRACRLLMAPVVKRFTSPKYAGLLEYGGTYAGAYLLRRGLFMPWELPELLGPEMAREGWQELRPLASLEETISGIRRDHLKVSALELTWYMRHQLLRTTDWAGMAHSLEIRVPLVDITFYRDILPLLALRPPLDKADLTKALGKPLPEEVLLRPKTGFRPPINQWLKEYYGHLSPQWERDWRGWALEIYRHFTGGRGRSRNLMGPAGAYENPACDC